MIRKKPPAPRSPSREPTDKRTSWIGSFVPFPDQRGRAVAAVGWIAAAPRARSLADFSLGLLVFCPGNSLTKSCEFLKDGVGCSSPHEGLRICVVTPLKPFSANSYVATSTMLRWLPCRSLIRWERDFPRRASCFMQVPRSMVREALCPNRPPLWSRRCLIAAGARLRSR